MKLHLLGVNGPFPQPRAATSGYLLEAGDGLFQFDVGSAVLSALTARTAPEDLTAVFLSHWHFDHAADLPVLAYRLQALKRSITVYAPEQPDSPLFQHIAAQPEIDLIPVSAGQELTLGDVRIRVTAARHPVPTVGYRVEQGGKTFGYTGDTNTLPSLAEDFRGCDLLLADALFPSARWTEQLPHLSAQLAATLAEEAGADRLILTHLNPLFPPRLLLEEARVIHPHTILAEAGTTAVL